MSGNAAAIVLANVLMLVLGAGLLPLLAPRDDAAASCVARLPLAYAVGIAGTGDPRRGARARARAGREDRAAAARARDARARAVAAAPPGARRTSGGRCRGGRCRRSRCSAVAAAYLASAARLFAVKPLLENDGWALWGLRAQALYDAGHPFAPVFTDPPYPALQYPLFLPGLEAVDARFMSSVRRHGDPPAAAGLAIAFVGAAWILLREHAPSLLLAAALLAVLTAPAFFGQLQTNSADVPLAMAIALGVAALAAWIRSGARGLLPAATLFLTAGAMTKNEGELFALCAFLAALAATPRARLRPLRHGRGAWVALIVPWHLGCSRTT